MLPQFSLLRTAPPPVEMTLRAYWLSSWRTLASMSLKTSSPFSSKMSATVAPRDFSMTSSVSKNL